MGFIWEQGGMPMDKQRSMVGKPSVYDQKNMTHCQPIYLYKSHETVLMRDMS